MKNYKKALLILDIQNDFTGENARLPVEKNQAVEMIKNVNFLIENSENLGLEIVYVGNEYSVFNPLNIFRNFAAIKNSEGAKLDEKLKIVGKNYFSKTQGNAFSNSSLTEFLRKENIEDVYISGLYAEACVLSSVKGAMKNGFKTSVISDAIATKSESKRKKCLQKYENIGAKVFSSKEIFFS